MALWVLTLLFAAGPRVAAWDYRQNGADWATIGMCGRGGYQSPIDLPSSVPAAPDDKTLFFKYPKLISGVTVYNTGKSIAITTPDSWKAGFGVGRGSDGVAKNVLEFGKNEDSNAFRLWQVNFHSPSEHSINGEKFPLEMQLMHQQVTGGDGMAVLVVLFNSAPNAYGEFLQSVIGKELPQRPWEEAVRQTGLDFGPLLRGSKYFTYEGSLTVPPCETQVRYFVRQEPIPAAHAQLQEFQKVLLGVAGPNGNFRAQQPSLAASVFMGAVDVLVPNSMVSPAKTGLATDSQAAAAAELKNAEAACEQNSDFMDYAWKTYDRITTSDSPKLAKAKTVYNAILKEEQATQTAISANQRNVMTIQGQYDAAASKPVERIHLAWELKAAEELLSATKARTGKIAEAHKKAQMMLLKEFLHVCAEEVVGKKREEAAEKIDKAEALKGSLYPKGEKETRHFEYSEPLVKLPEGISASPFSVEAPDPKNVVMSSKIAANLKQQEVPESEQVVKAKGKDMSPPAQAPEPIVLSLKLPMKPDKEAAFSKDLIAAVAKSSKVPESRFELKEVKAADVPKVAGTSSLAQVSAMAPTHKNLRSPL